MVYPALTKINPTTWGGEFSRETDPLAIIEGDFVVYNDTVSNFYGFVTSVVAGPEFVIEMPSGEKNQISPDAIGKVQP